MSELATIPDPLPTVGHVPRSVRVVRSEADKQRHRFKLYLMAMGSSTLVMGLLYLLMYLGHMDSTGFRYTVILMLSEFALFAGLFRSNLNLRAKDPSLTAEMMVASLLGLSMAMYYADSTGRGMILMIYLVSFIFGIMRLQVRELLLSGLLTALMYAGVIGLLYWLRPASMELHIELLRLLVMSCVLAWFSLIGGNISRVRKKLSDNNAELESALKTIQELASHDALTGLHNRRHLELTLHHEVSQSLRSQRPFCVCLVDIDHFKSINDSYGHQCGDEVLRGFADCVRPGLRKSDHFGRYGGEEFLAILTNTEVAGAVVWAEHLRDKLAQLSFAAGHGEFRFTVSIGVAQYQVGEDVEKTVARADTALYRAKAAGRNRVVIAAL